MKVGVRYFARMREAMGVGGETVDVPAQVGTVGQLRSWLQARGDPWAAAFARVQPLRTALDHEFVDDAARLREGAEVAFLPPVTGG